jgi:hypothetical protein
MMKMIAHSIDDGRRATFTNRGRTPVAARRAERHALALARIYGPGWEHHVGLTCYVTDRDGLITRIVCSDDGQHINERRIQPRRA